MCIRDDRGYMSRAKYGIRVMWFGRRATVPIQGDGRVSERNKLAEYLRSVMRFTSLQEDVISNIKVYKLKHTGL